MTDIDWKFSDLDASGQKKGGDPSEKAFEGNFDTFVREAVQNSNDAAVERPAEVFFDLVELTGDDLSDFKERINWEKLERHLNAVASSGRMKKVNRFLERLEENESLRILKVEDRNCEGLTGAEDDDSSNFTGLMKHTLFSNKGEGSGGSHGMGKSVYWRFSEAATVLGTSYLTEEPDEKTSPRFIGRTNLPSHETIENGDEMEYSGPGWFGKISETEVNGKKRVRAESVWGEDAEEISEKLYNSHTSETTGTSLSIIGFSEPTSERRSPAEIKNLMENAAIEHFWPALHKQRNYLNVKIRDVAGAEKSVKLREDDDVWPFVECWNAFLQDDYSDEFKFPGDIVKKEVEVSLPDKKNGEETQDASATLVVRRADRDVDAEYQNQMAMFRSPGMVVNYKNYGNVSVAAQPFHAILICGEAKPESDVDESDEDLEEFLKNAEPPAHDKWKSTQNLRENYKPGYKKALKELERNAREALKDVIVPEVKDGERGPDKLSTKFDMSRKKGGSKKKGKNPLNFTDLSGHLNGDSWKIYGFIECGDDDHYGWTANIELQIVGEDGSHYEKIPIETINSPNAESSIEDGVAKLNVPQGEFGVQFEGDSEELGEDVRQSEIEMKITGQVKEE